MAFNVRRFVAYFALLAVLLTAGMVGLLKDPLRFEQRTQRSNSARATRLASALAVLQRRDSIVRALRSAPPRPGLSIVLPAATAPRDRLAIEAMIRRFWRDAVGEAARFPVIVLVPADAGRPPYPGVHPQSVDYVLLPSMTDGRACVIVLNPAMDAAARSRSLGTVATRMRQHAGACAFLAKYGSPGPAMTRWLASAAWNPARLAVAGRDSADSRSSYSVRDTVPPRTSGAAAMRGYSFGSDADEFNMYAAHISCLAGNDAMCTPTESRRNQYGLRGPTWAEALVPAGVMAVPRYWRTSIPEDALLSTVEDAIGPGRFAELWATDRPIPDAIRDASGVSLDELFKRRLARGLPPLASTPWPTPTEWLVNLGLMGACIAFVARTRRHNT